MTRKVNYRKIASGFISDFMSYMAPVETPHAYDFWCACWLLSLACGRSVYIDRPRIPVHMNWYVMLLSESGVTRKSTAVRAATRVARWLKQYNDDFRLIQTKTSPEHLERMMHDDALRLGSSHTAISISELANVLGRERYLQGMPALLTDLYDCPEQRGGGGTIAKGEKLLRNVYLSFLSASTPSWLAGRVNPDIVEGGFTSRCIYVVEDQRKSRTPWPDDADYEGDEAHVMGLAKALESIARRARERQRIVLNPEALRAFSNWYKRRPESRDPFRASFEAREDDHVLRLSGTLALSVGRFVVSMDDVRAATRIIEEVKENGALMFVGSAVTDELVRAIDRLRLVLIEGGLEGYTQSELYLRVRTVLDNATFKLVLKVLHELEMVQKFEEHTKGRVKTIWRATNLIQSKDSVKALMKEMGK